MKLLVITQHIEKTAPGKVFNTLITSLSKYCQVDVITNNKDSDRPTLLPENVNLTLIPEPIFLNKGVTYHLNRIFLKFFKTPWSDWRVSLMKTLINESYDCVLALCSMYNTIPLVLARKISRKYDLPIAVYFVDAIPVPLWWKSESHKQLGDYIRKQTFGVKYFASANPVMLEYQKQFLHESCKKFDVLYTPYSNSRCNLSKKQTSDCPVFLYTGSIYGLRKTTHLLSAFEKLLKEYPDAQLHFVGSNDFFRNTIPSYLLDNVKVFPFTNDLNPFYDKATALIDIDADCDNDVYLSSKVANYLCLPRMVICITGNGSPAQCLFSGIDSIQVVHHNLEEIYTALKTAIERSGELKIDDRDYILELFDPDKTASHLARELKIIHKR